MTHRRALRLEGFSFSYVLFAHMAWVCAMGSDTSTMHAERIENLIVLTREMQACAEGDDAVMQALRSALS